MAPAQTVPFSAAAPGYSVGSCSPRDPVFIPKGLASIRSILSDRQTDTRTIRPAGLRITVIFRVVNTHLAVGTTESGDSTADVWCCARLAFPFVLDRDACGGGFTGIPIGLSVTTADRVVHACANLRLRFAASAFIRTAAVREVAVFTFGARPRGSQSTACGPLARIFRAGFLEGRSGETQRKSE